MVESFAIKIALNAAQSAGFRSINVFSDSLSLVSFLNSMDVVNELKSLLHEIICLSSGFISIGFFYVSRSANGIVDALAKFALVSVVNNPSIIGV